MLLLAPVLWVYIFYCLFYTAFFPDGSAYSSTAFLSICDHLVPYAFLRALICIKRSGPKQAIQDYRGRYCSVGLRCRVVSVGFITAGISACEKFRPGL
jgi:hypothetical protein